MSNAVTRALFDVGPATRADSEALVSALLERWDALDDHWREKLTAHAMSAQNSSLHSEAECMLGEIDSMVTAIESSDNPFQNRLGQQLVAMMDEFTQTLKQTLDSTVP